MGGGGRAADRHPPGGSAPNPNHRVLAVDYDRLIAMLTRLNRLDEARSAQERQAFHRRLRDAEVPE